jgi:Predicted epimerase, PhzC/PhzF homolog
LDCINIDINDIGIEGNKVTPKIISTGLPDLLLPINSKNKLDNLKVDLNKLKEFSRNMNITGVHAFHLPRLDSEIVYTRNFAPLVGIDEESATGTSNGALIFFLKDGGYVKGNEIISLQGESLNRPSRIHCIIDEEDGKYNVRVGGEARIVIEGILSF